MNINIHGFVYILLQVEKAFTNMLALENNFNIIIINTDYNNYETDLLKDYLIMNSFETLFKETCTVDNQKERNVLNK